MIKKGCTILVVIFGWLNAFAFEYVDQKTSYEDNRLLSLHVGAGINNFAFSKGIEGGHPGLLFQLGLGHRISQYLGAEFVYQLSTFRYFSPDPIVAGDLVNTRAGLHQEYLRLKLFYPKVVAQPYVSVGIGAYQFLGVDGGTALSLPTHMMLPVGVGVQTFIVGNSISLDFDFSYHFFFGENQDARTLDILSVSEVSFDMYSLTGGFSFHFF